MPEDQVQVTEQATGAETVNNDTPSQGAEAQDKEFMAGFDEQSAEDTGKTQGEKAEEEQSAEEKEEEEGEQQQEEQTETTGKEGETVDEDFERGKALMDAENARQAEADKKKREQEEAERERRNRDAAGRRPRYPKMTPELASSFSGYADPSLFEGTIKVGDTEVNLGDYVRDNPETAIIAGAVMNNFLSDLFQAGIIMSPEAIKEKFGPTWEKGMGSTLQSLQDEIFDLKVAAGGVPNAAELINTPEWKEWFPKQKDEIKAHSRSDDPADHVKLLKRFIKESRVGGERKKADIDKAQREAKEKKDRLFSTTVRSGKGKSIGRVTDGKFVSTGDADSEFEAGFDEGGNER